MKFVVGYLLAISLLYSVQCIIATRCTGKYAYYPRDCNKYIQCDQGNPIVQSCGPGLHWNNNISACDWPYRANCPYGPSKPNIPYPPTTRPVGPIGPNIQAVPNGNSFKVVCYFNNWAGYRQGKGNYLPENIDGNLCTHIIYSFATLDVPTSTVKMYDQWADYHSKFYERVTAYRQRGIKVLISIGGWSDSFGSKYSGLLLNEYFRHIFIGNAIQFVKMHNFDGLDLDLEYPACWQGNCEPARFQEKEGFAQLVKELSIAFKPHGLLLSAAVSANKRVIDAAYNIPKLAQYLDWINLMAYGFRGYYDHRTGNGAPLYSNYYYPDNLNSDFAVKYWIQSGTPAKKLVLGVSSYGQSFTLANVYNNGLNAPSIGPGAPGQYTRQGGILSFYEICERTKYHGWTVVRDPRVGTFAFHDNQWVSYDDIENIRIKAEYIRSLKLGGGMISTLDFDDISGSCGCGKHPLLTTMNQVLRGIGYSQLNNCT